MGEHPQDRGREAESAGETLARRCALILVDLSVPSGVDPDALRAVLARWAQETRFASVVEIDGARAGDARGVVINGSLDAVVQSLASLVR